MIGLFFGPKRLVNIGIARTSVQITMGMVMVKFYFTERKQGNRVRCNLDERIKLASMRKFHAQIIVGYKNEYLLVERSNYAGSTTSAVTMFLRDCDLQKDCLYYLRVCDADGEITYWVGGIEPLLDILVKKPCPNTVWNEARAGVSNTRPNHRHLDSLGTEKKWGELSGALLPGEEG